MKKSYNFLQQILAVVSFVLVLMLTSVRPSLQNQ